MFSWTLVHGRILTGDNLERRGFAGPFRCPMCFESKETIQHLFLDYPYARNVWDNMISPWFGNTKTPGNIQHCFVSWEQAYNGALDKKEGVKNCWLKLPKVIFWHIWIECNLRTFQDKTQPPEKKLQLRRKLLWERFLMCLFFLKTN